MSALSDWLQRIMFATINLGSLICCKLLQIEVTLELYLSPFFHKGKNMEELATNTKVSKGDLENYNYQWHMIIYILYCRVRH